MSFFNHSIGYLFFLYSKVRNAYLVFIEIDKEVLSQLQSSEKFIGCHQLIKYALQTYLSPTDPIIFLMFPQAFYLFSLSYSIITLYITFD